MNRLQIIAGSGLFNLFYLVWTLSLMLVLLPLIAFPAPMLRRGIAIWPRGVNLALKHLCRIEIEIRGRENLPNEPTVFACKHQSAWETMYFLQFDPDIAYTMKRELLRIPLWGWYMNKTIHVTIDRAGGTRALRAMIRETSEILNDGRSVVIFPEGTRIAAGETGIFHPGIAAVYGQIAAPVVPVALNSGVLWSRRSYLKRPGHIIVEFLPAMPTGLDRKEFMDELRQRIEIATRRLEGESCG